MPRKNLLIMIMLAVFSFLSVSCTLSTSEPIFKTENNDAGEQIQPPDNPSEEIEEESVAAGEKVNRDCFTEDNNLVAQDIAERFETSSDLVEEWYCEGNSFEDIMLALMTSRLWEIDPEQVLLEHETKTWDEIWEELDDTLQ
jgi:hypothetical protein